MTPRPRRSWRRRTFLGTLAVLASLVGLAQAASADVTTIKVNPTRQGWRGDLPALKPPGFQQFDTAVSGQVYAQPLVVGNLVIVATENDVVYGINKTTGKVIWQRSVGRAEPVAETNCLSAVETSYGVTSTPVIDTSGPVPKVYLVARTWDGTNPGSATYHAFALNATNGAVLPGWPATGLQIRGSASNDPSSTFDPTVQLQRTGLLLLGGRIVFGFASFCDLGAYKGWISTISTSTRAQSLWTDEAGSNVAGGIWQAGGGLASDGTSIFVATGNGSVPNPGPGTTPQPAVGESTLRLTVDGNGNLHQADRFTPHDALALSNNDLDLGAGGPVLLPDNFGSVANHPHLEVQPSKTSLYLLDRDDLGGMVQPNQTDNVVDELPNQPSFSHAAVWPGDGGYFYLPGSALRAYKVLPTGKMVLAASTNDQFDFSGSPVITSNQTTPGSATLWVIQKTTGQLKAYNPVPVNGTLQLLWSAPIGTANKFTVPATDGSNVFVGTFGHVMGFSAPHAPIPSAVVSSQQYGLPGQTDVFSVAPNGAVTVRWVQGGGAWAGPLLISQPGVAPPGARLAVSNQFGIPNQTDVFVVGDNGAVQVFWVQGGGLWAGPLGISRSGLAPPGAALAASNQFGIPNQTDVFVVDATGTADVLWVAGGGVWAGPLGISRTGLAPQGAALAASNQFGIPNQTDVFVVDTTGTADVLWVDTGGPWAGPLGISPAGLAPPGAALVASNQFGLPSQTDAFVVDSTGASQVVWVVNGGTWNGPLDLSA
jgi:hypothetical protein